MSEWLGKMLGKVRIDSLLARGGIAEVYLGEHVALQREVAVKILRNQYEDDPDLLERFQREARVVAKLRHSNIVQVFDFDAVDNRPYLVMEYIPGISLSRYLHVLHGRNGRLELPVISRIITQVAHALQYAHESGVIHRDVKPGNILLTSRTEKVMAGKALPGDFEPILTDFGLVRFLNSSKQTTTGVIAGTPAYMSPEQARGEPTDERTDIYSLGIVLYELLAGHIPFDGETTMSIILKHVTEPPPPIPNIPYLLQQVLDRALAKKPEDRFQTANDLANAFAASLHGIDTEKSDTLMEIIPEAVTHITKVGYKDKSKLKTRWAPVLLAGAVVALFSGFFYYKGSFTPSTPTATQPIPTLSPMPTAVTSTPTPIPAPAGVIHFQDGATILDQVTLRALTMVVPPDGSHYEIWLTGGAEWKNFGILILNSSGAGELVSKDKAGENLVALYNQVYVTIELNSDIDASPSNMIAYYSGLPSDGLSHLKHLLVSSSEAPEGVALIQGLNAEIELIDRTVREMQSAYQRGNETNTKRNAEALLNLLAGNQSEDYKDWDNDGKITDISDGFGLVPTDEATGYLFAVTSHTEDTINSLHATQPMIKHGDEVKICANNLEDWTAQLRDFLTTIVAAPSGTDLSQPVLDSVALASQLLNGMDTDNDKNIDAVAGECGMSSLYRYAYSMADMPLAPYDPSLVIPTATATATPTGQPTKSDSSGSNNTSVPSNPGGGGGGGKPPTKEPNENKPTPKPGKN